MGSGSYGGIMCGQEKKQKQYFRKKLKIFSPFYPLYAAHAAVVGTS